MARNLGTDRCPRCQQTWSLSDAYGKPLIRISYRDPDSPVNVLGVKLRCSCGIDLFLWLRADITHKQSKADAWGFEEVSEKDAVLTTEIYPDSGEIDVSYFHTFNTECLPGRRYTELEPRPEGTYFAPKGTPHETIRGMLAHREVRWKDYLQKKANWGETGVGEEPTWVHDTYQHPVFWFPRKDEYAKETACLEFSSCTECLKFGTPFDNDEPEERDLVVYYLGETPKKHIHGSLVYFMGSDGEWHPAKISNSGWHHESQSWRYELVDLYKESAGNKCVKREDELMVGKPGWEYTAVRGEQLGEQHGDSS
jgi:hypothetical protein